MEVALQKQLEGVVRDKAFLHDTAAAAYQSFLRGYAAHSKEVSRLVHVGQLHLGHLLDAARRPGTGSALELRRNEAT